MTAGERSWSLVRYLRARIAAVATLPLLVSLGLGGLFLDRAIDREVEALLFEELAEATTLLADDPQPATSFADHAKELASHHPRTPMAWRLFDGSGETLASFGVLGLLSERQPSPRPTQVGERYAFEDRLVRTVAINDSLNLGLVLDVTALADSLRWYWLIAAALFLVTGGIGLVAAYSITSRTGDLFRHVADSVDGVAPSAGFLPPVEVQAVSDRLRASFTALRVEAERIRVFTAGLAHELRSPIQNLIARAEVALTRDRDADEYRTLIRAQLDECTELSDAVDNLLTLCTIGRISTGCESFDLADEVRMRLIRESAKGLRKRVRLSVTSSGDTTIAGDREHVLRAVRNVVANAIQWSPPDQAVDVRIDGLQDRVRVTVDDAGPGIPPSERSDVFDAFVTRRSPGGSRVGYGLGLAISRAAVDDGGGEIAIDTSPMGGARLVLTLPRLPEPDDPVPADDHSHRSAVT